MDPDKRSCRARLRARLASACAAGRARLRAERGSALIEVMVGAVVLAIATTAVLSGIDGAQRAGAKNKARSVQATLAQQDIERLRSIPITALFNYRETRTVAVAGVNYTVVSRTDWVRDASGVVGCTADQGQAQYLKLSSTVTSPSTTNQPVEETALLTPGAGQLSPTAGTATVRLTDRDGQPYPGVTVGLSGPGSFSEQTDNLGCAVFGYIPAGNYTAEVAGLVTTASTVPAQQALSVAAGKASNAEMQVARPAMVRATFVAPAGNTLAPATALAWGSITVKNAKLPAGKKVFTQPVANSVDAPDLFPFADGVGVYAGNCAANDPTAYNANYFATSGRGFTALDPGDALRPVNVEMPTLRVNITRQPAGSPLAVPTWTRTQVRVTAIDAGCSYTYQAQPLDRTASATAVSFDLALPFGRYRVCGYTRGRTSASNSTVINRRYTTTTTAGASPTNPADPNLTTPIPAQPNRQITITTPSASTTASNATCF